MKFLRIARILSAPMGLWGNYGFDMFQFSIQETPEGLCHKCALLPFIDSTKMQSIKNEIDFMGYVEYPGGTREQS